MLVTFWYLVSKIRVAFVGTYKLDCLHQDLIRKLQKSARVFFWQSTGFVSTARTPGRLMKRWKSQYFWKISTFNHISFSKGKFEFFDERRNWKSHTPENWFTVSKIYYEPRIKLLIVRVPQRFLLSFFCRKTKSSVWVITCSTSSISFSVENVTFLKEISFEKALVLLLR